MTSSSLQVEPTKESLFETLRQHTLILKTVLGGGGGGEGVRVEREGGRSCEGKDEKDENKLLLSPKPTSVGVTP